MYVLGVFNVVFLLRKQIGADTMTREDFILFIFLLLLLFFFCRYIIMYLLIPRSNLWGQVGVIVLIEIAEALSNAMIPTKI
jgi:hypothetical protein